MKIKKKFTSESSHIVRGAVTERCRTSIHGHSYKWYVTLWSSTLQSNGMVLDFKELTPVKEFIDKFDHATIFWEREEAKIISFFRKNFQRVLVMKKNTTAENMARLVFHFVTTWLVDNYPSVKVVKVEVWETETGCGIAEDCDNDDILV